MTNKLGWRITKKRRNGTSFLSPGDAEDVVRLISLPRISAADWNDEEKQFISQLCLRNRSCSVHPIRHSVAADDPSKDFIDNVVTSDIWRKISTVLGPGEYDKLWSDHVFYYETAGQLQVSLNGHLLAPSIKFLCTPVRRSVNAVEKDAVGYNPRELIKRGGMMQKKYSSSPHLLPKDFEKICSVIESQQTGVICEEPQLCSSIPIRFQTLLKKFTRKDFSCLVVRQKLASYVKNGKSSVIELKPFLNDVLDFFVPRCLIGSKKEFDRMKSNILRVFELNPRHPVRLRSLMKGLPTYDFPMNVFLAKFVLFLYNTFVVQMMAKLFYVTESLRDNKIIFIKKRAWINFEAQSVQKMISDGILEVTQEEPTDSRVSRMRIKYKPGGFRPLVFASPLHKSRKCRLEVCNTFLKQVAVTINEGYGRVLDHLHAQWMKLPRRRNKIYFVRTDVSDAFNSVRHDKLQEILGRRLSALGPNQVYRVFGYSAQGKKKIAAHFTTLQPRLRSKLIYGGTKKIYPTSLLKAEVVRYIKQNRVSVDGKTVLRHVKGVPQGCPLSPVLCELYLADMDDCYFNHMKDNDEILVRGVDDYLFVTYDERKANMFLDLVHSGIPDYGITFQLDKTVTNLKCPHTCTSFFGYKLYPHCRKIEPDFGDDPLSRTTFYPQMTWQDLGRRMKRISYVKLNGLVFNPIYLEKFVVMKNIFECSKIHAGKYKVIHHFLTENCVERPTFRDQVMPILSASSIIAAKVTRNSDRKQLSFYEVKYLVLKAFIAVLLPEIHLNNITAYLTHHAARIMARGGFSSRTKKLLKSLIAHHIDAI